MFKEIDLSRAVRSNTVAITFRYQITSGAEEVPFVAWLADNVHGEDPIRLGRSFRSCYSPFANCAKALLQPCQFAVPLKPVDCRM